MTTNIKDENLATFIRLVDEYKNTTVFEAAKARKLSDEILDLSEKVPGIANDCFKYWSKEPLSEATISNIFQLGGIISYMNKRVAQFSQKELDMFYIVQHMFDCYLRFQLPFKLWPELANTSWSYLVDFINDKYPNKKAFESETQRHWISMTKKLDEFQDHPQYGPKIQARLTGYV